MTESSSSSTTADVLSESLADAAELAAPGVVAVHSRRRMPGSGVVWSTDDDGTIVITASHIVEREDRISVRLSNMSFVDATLLGRDLGRDLAILRIATDGLTPGMLRSRPSRIGNLALALGRPFPPAFQATFGSIQAIGSLQSRRSASDLLIRSNVAMLPGFSGGPLIDPAGAVIGINTSGLLWKGGVTIPSDHVTRIASDIRKFGHVRAGWIGVSVQQADLPASLISQPDDQDVALLVTGIADGSPAASAQLLVGDMLISLGEQPLRDTPDLQILLSSEKIDQEVELTVLRGGAIRKVQVTPGERPGCASK